MAYTKLTAKQEEFCQCVASGMTLTDSYKQAYNAENMSKQVIFNESSKLAKRDDITKRIQEIRKPLENHYHLSAISETERVKQILWDIVHATDEKTENQIRALDMINRMNGAYTADTKQDDTESTIDNLDTDKLLQLVSSA